MLEQRASLELVRTIEWYYLAELHDEGSKSKDALEREVTELRRRVAEIEEAEHRYRNLFDTAMVGLYQTRIDDGQMVEANLALSRLMGYETREQFLREFRTSEHYADPDQRAELLRQLREHGSVDWFQITATSRDGSQVPIAISATLYPERGVLEGVVMDLTMLKRAEAERRELEAHLQHTQKLESLGVLAGGIAHDFNNLLVAILGNASLSLAKLPEDAEARKNIADIEKAATRAAGLCKQMLAYAGQESLQVKPVDLSELVQEMVHIMGVPIAKKARLTCDVPDEPVVIEADVAQIHQVILNLMTNAAESFDEHGGVVTIETGLADCTRDYLDGTVLGRELPEARYAFVEVRDDGSGMEAETMSKIFHPFFTTKFVGRGLGLAATLGIVRAHGGAVEVTSELGRGSTFRVLFPESSHPVEDTDAPSDELEGWRGEGTVLLVDDEEAVRSVAARMLSLLGFDTLVATGGREAVELVRQRAGELRAVLLDLTMPDQDGAETLREIRRLAPQLHVLISSGYGEKEVMDRVDDRASVPFVQKPYSVAKLRSALRRVLAERVRQ